MSSLSTSAERYIISTSEGFQPSGREHELEVALPTISDRDNSFWINSAVDISSVTKKPFSSDLTALISGFLKPTIKL